MSNIFGNPNNQPKPSGSNIFGNLGQTTTTTSQTTPSLFGAAPTTTTSSGFSLFGTAPAATNSPIAKRLYPVWLTRSLTASTTVERRPFSGLSGASKPPAQNLFGGLFGAQTQAQQQGSTTATSQPAPTQSLFGGLGQQQQQQAEQTQQQQQPQNGPSAQAAYFDHLLERGKKRNMQDGASVFGELPSLQLGLGDIARKVRNLGTGGPSAQAAKGTAEPSGVQTGPALRELNSFSASAGVGPPSSLQPVDTDLDAYVSNLRTQSTFDLIAEGLEQSKRDFDNFLEENVQIEWDAQRRKIYEHFGLVRKDEPLNLSTNGASTSTPAQRGAFGRSSRRARPLNASAFGASGMARSVLGAAPGTVTEQGEKPSEDRFSREKQEKYSEKVKQLNTMRQDGYVYPVIQNFAEMEAQAGVDSTSQLVDAYKALVEITGEDANKQLQSDAGAIKERQYAKDYLDEAPNSQRSIAIRKRILDGSRRFLEKSFYRQLETAIAKNPREANLGGVPSTLNKIRAYIRLRSARKELGADNVQLQMLGDDYCWVLIFYLLRCGLVREAAQYVMDNERAIKSMERSFPQFMTAYANSEDRRLPPDMQRTISGIYNQRVHVAPAVNQDPYQLACYKILGRCELSKRSLDKINQGMEDWVWLQFNLAREVSRVEESAGEAFGLEDLRATIKEIGQRHFPAGSEAAGGGAVFFFLQILAGLFEEAVAYLYRHNYVSAVHFGIALDYYGLLRVSDFNVAGLDLLTYTTKNQPQINFARMIGMYTADFRAAKAETAVDYLALICLNADLPGQLGQSQATVCHEALTELVLETREFAQLLGDIRSDGSRIPGCIEQRMRVIKVADQRTFLKSITVRAASVADDSGRIADAVLLYHLAEEYDNVVSILNRTLSEALAVDLGQDSMRLEPLRPRQPQSSSPGQQQIQDSNSSLSLTSVEDPAVLADNFMRVYERNAMYNRKIRPENRDVLRLLLKINTVKTHISAGQWDAALDAVVETSLLPINANGSLPAIRAAAQNFNQSSTVLSKCIPNLLVWTILACGRQREHFLQGQFEPKAKEERAEKYLSVARDLMVFAGLVRFRLPPRVSEMLARVGQDVGV
ncbi:nuclear pore complex subunit [Coniosporium tulheliwenetii]|uniref:Nuclear pore complex subunit n=1 Tax=Coniosporium tulheliwenetii TaxID=3383036 RepID=A0ACC2ZPG0_9PEZI|nr:nuclear pore complex subunit [Cladosporium sp. JES 115]